MPAGIGPAGPTQLIPVVRSRMLSLPGMVRAGLEPFLTKMTPPLPADQDISVGDFLSSRFGDEVVREVLGTSVRALPRVLLEQGFAFAHPSVDAAMADLLTAQRAG